MKLNLGCGYNKLEGYVNVDLDPLCKPDILADLEKPLPFDDNSIDEINLFHVLEHIGADTQTYFAIWREFYRILKHDGILKIVVPHWNHENFYHDPTHVRVVTPVGINMFNQEHNRQTIAEGGNETTLGLQLGIDIRVTDVGYDFMPWFQQYITTIPKHAVDREMKKYNNACYQIHIIAKAHKHVSV